MPRTDSHKAGILPLSLPPIGIGREQAAELIGVSPSTFDKAVAAGSMPQPRILGGRLLWDVREIHNAFVELPHRNVDAIGSDFEPIQNERNVWDDAKAVKQ